MENSDIIQKPKTEKNGTVPREDGRFDKGALNGLRGLFAFHVMAFHACLFLAGNVEPKVNLYAHIDMPLFFLLSGFSLTLAYGKTKWNGSTRGCFGCKTNSADGVNAESSEQDLKFFDSWEFYKRRLIRILPLHYLAIILVLIMWKFGIWPTSVEEMWTGVPISIFAINTWLLPYNNFNPNGPAWTISTLSFWYWCFPFILPRLQRLTNKELAKGIVKYFWLGVGINYLLLLCLGAFIPGGDKGPHYWMTTAHPLFRLPVFLMGVLGGLQVLRAHSDWDNFEDPNLNKNLLHAVHPWGCGKSKCCSKKNKSENSMKKASDDKDRSKKIWRKRVDFSAFLYVVILTGLCVTKVALDITYDDEKDRNFYIGAYRNDNGTFEWANETTTWDMEWTNWWPGQPGNDGGEKDCRGDDCRERCAALWGRDSNGKNLKWHDVSCTDSYRIICQYPNMLDKCSERPHNSSCLDGTFYNVSDSKHDAEKAFSICEKTGGSLVTIPNDNVQEFLFGLINKGEDVPRLNGVVKFFFQTDEFWKIFLQTHLVHLQLTIIIGLCMDGGKSLVSRFLRTKMLQFLGRISLSLYLLHWPLMGVVLLAINGPHSFSTSGEVWAAYKSGDLIAPLGTPAIHIIISPIICFIATKYFEEPITKILRGTK